MHRKALPANEVLAHLHISVASGLAGEEVKCRLQTFGPNMIVSTAQGQRACGAAAPVPQPGDLSAWRGDRLTKKRRQEITPRAVALILDRDHEQGCVGESQPPLET
jgi:hypothetical protein